MAVQHKPKDTRMAVRKGNKTQGKSAKAGEKADNRVAVTPNGSLDRGLGSSYAYAVGVMREEANNLKGSQNGFLGQPKETIDVKQFVHSLQKDK